MNLTRRLLLASAASLPLLRAAAASADEAPRVGEVLEATGHGQLLRGEALLSLSPGTDLRVGDTATTGEDGLALLFLDQRTRINLGASSTLELAAFLTEIGGTINVGGAMVFDRPEDLPPLDLNFVTAFGEIGVRGTRFFVGPSRGDYAVFVQRGQVAVTGAGETRLLNAGDGCSLHAGAAPGDVTAWGEPRIVEAFASLGIARE